MFYALLGLGFRFIIIYVLCLFPLRTVYVLHRSYTAFTAFTGSKRPESINGAVPKSVVAL